MAHYYSMEVRNVRFLRESVKGISLINRLELAFRVPAVRNGSPVIHTSEAFRGVDFGFRDDIYITGALSYPTILKYRDALQLSFLFQKLADQLKDAYYRKTYLRIQELLAQQFITGYAIVLISPANIN